MTKNYPDSVFEVLRTIFEPVVYDKSGPFAGFEEKVFPKIKVDVAETTEKYIVHAEMGGVKKEDILVNIHDGILTISAESKTERKEEDKEHKYLRQERYYGKMERKFSLDKDVDEDNVIAKYDDGVLVLELNKKLLKQVNKWKSIECNHNK